MTRRGSEGSPGEGPGPRRGPARQLSAPTNGPAPKRRPPSTFTAEYWDRRATVPELLNALRWAAAEIWAAAPGPALLLAAGQLAEGLAPAAQLYATKRLIDAVVHSSAVPSLLPWIGAILVATVIGGAAGNQLRGPVRHRLDHRVQFALQRRRFTKASQLPLLFFEDSASYDLLSRSDNPGFKTTSYATGGLTFVSGAINLATVALLFWTASPWLTLGLLAATVPQALRAADDGRRWMRLMYGQTEDQRKAAYIDGVIVGRAEQKEVRTFGIAPPLQRRWRDLRRQLRATAAAEHRSAAARGLAPNAFEYAIATAAVVALALALGHHRLTVGGFAALFGAVGQLQSAAFTLTSTLRDMRPDAADVRYVRDFLALPEDDRRRGAAAFANPLREGIRLHGVTFAYPGRDEPVLRDLDLHLRPGERAALVGENGAGKSTLVKLLLGLYHPTAGHLSADGVDYSDIDPESLHDGVAAAFQDFYNFEFTAAQSIGVGRSEAFGGPEGLDPDPVSVERAARQAGAHTFVEALPEGYATPVGHLDDHGQGLSGGQWQRLAIARTFMRDPQLLILDEPTAALDPKAEAEVYGRFAQLLEGRAGLLISHRLGSARLCDRILVLKGGRIIEDGRHDDLLAVGGEYARMWEEQAQWYR